MWSHRTSVPTSDVQDATLAMGTAKVLQGMRGMFIKVAKDEVDVLVEEFLRLENGNGEEGLLLEGVKMDDVIDQPLWKS